MKSFTRKSGIVCFVFFFFLFLSSCAIGPGKVKPNNPLPFSIELDGVVSKTGVTIDQNWRWWHDANGFKNCFDNGWDKSLCPSEIECGQKCVIEGVDASDYDKAYGVSVSDNILRLNFARKNDHGLNIGSRLYLLDSSLKNYQGFDLRGKELSFDIDLSTAGCGLNSAVYFVEMPTVDSFGVGSAYGVNYGDAQCAQDIKLIGGQVNFGSKGACSIEMDILEANRHATAFTAHPCAIQSVSVCNDETSCGAGAKRFSGVCDKNGADFNPYRMGNHTLYGFGKDFIIDSSKPFTVLTSFITDNGNSNGKLVKIQRFLAQDGKKVFVGELTDQSVASMKELFKENNRFASLGGLKNIGDSFSRKMVLVFSFWDDSSTHMQWLDSTFGGDPKAPGTVRGPCPNPPLSTEETRQKFADAFVLFSNVKVRSLKPPITPVPSSKPSVQPSMAPSSGSHWMCNQCVLVKS